MTVRVDVLNLRPIMADVFISYSSDERALADALAHDLEARGYDVWWDTDLVGGASFRKQIATKLAEARSVIVIWSEKSVGSPWVLDEADQAAADEKLIPVLERKFDAKALPLGHRQRQAYPLEDRERILGALTAMGVRPSEQRTSPAPVNPAQAKKPFGLIAAIGVGVILLIGAGVYLIGSPSQTGSGVVETTFDPNSDPEYFRKREDAREQYRVIYTDMCGEQDDYSWVRRDFDDDYRRTGQAPEPACG
jgi:hypothetical protein